MLPLTKGAFLDFAFEAEGGGGRQRGILRTLRFGKQASSAARDRLVRSGAPETGALCARSSCYCNPSGRLGSASAVLAWGMMRSQHVVEQIGQNWSKLAAWCAKFPKSAQKLSKSFSRSRGSAQFRWVNTGQS